MFTLFTGFTRFKNAAAHDFNQPSKKVKKGGGWYFPYSHRSVGQPGDVSANYSSRVRDMLASTLMQCPVAMN